MNSPSFYISFVKNSVMQEHESSHASSLFRTAIQPKINVPFAALDLPVSIMELDESSHAERGTLRIMISTDNHLGVHESDPIRKDDSFRAFEEVLQKAVHYNADMVLLGGDLFHENKPSRDTLVKSMQILKKYCLNDRPVSFQLLSDQKVNFPSIGQVNYEDGNMNIGLPVFTIHGNHDDPAGSGRLSAVDILSQANLVNYFGNMELEGSNVGRLKISPILIQKEDTFVALYGLGNIRDERLARLFKTPGSVEWEQPASENDCSKWYNLFVLHQNREKRGQKNFLDEACLPPFLDLVVWGHEHQCIPEASSTLGEFDILQAGSTVATSLSEGEADAKHCFMLEVLKENYRIVKCPLESVRPFVYKQVILHSQEGLRPDDTQGIEQFLEDTVVSLIGEAVKDFPHNENRDSMLPLVRLKVDYTGFSTVNVQRFGQRFVNHVANPQDILIFSKHVLRRLQNTGSDVGIDLKSLRPEQLDQTKIEDLVAENLGPGESLEILMEDELRDALQRFVDKDEKSALAECVHGLLQRLQSDVELLRNRSLAKTLPQQSMGDAIRAEVGDAIRAEVTRHALARMDNVARGSDSTEKGRERTDTRSRAGYFQSLEATDNLATTATIARTTNSNYSAGQTYLKNFLQPHSSTVSQSGTHGSDNSGRKQQIPEGSRSNNGRQFISSQRPKRAKVQQTADSSTDEILDEDIRSDDDWGVLDDIGQDHIPPMKGQGSNNTAETGSKVHTAVRESCRKPSLSAVPHDPSPSSTPTNRSRWGQLQ